MAGVALVNPKIQFFDSLGAPLVSGTVTVYVAGSTTLTDTWQDEAKSTLNTNPITLDARGECSLYGAEDVKYKFLLKNAAGVTQYTQDNISGSQSAIAAAASATALAASSGSSLVGYIHSGTGAVARTLQAKLRGMEVDVEDFGATGDGVTGDAAEFQAAIDAVAALGGGTVRFSKKYRIESNITVKDNVWLKGTVGIPGQLLPVASANYDGQSGLLFIDSGATITTLDGASVSNCVVMRYGLDLPFADAAAATAGVAAFAGTAFTVGGVDSYFGYMLILGFEYAVTSDSFWRIRCEYIQGDCTNGIHITSCADIAYVNECHFWPWTTVHQAWTTNALLRRTGTAFKFATVGDWNKPSNCFSFGYYRGFHATSVNSMTFLNCGADNTSTAGVGDYAGAIGFLVDGSSQDTRFVFCQAAAQAQGFYQDTTAGLHTRYFGCDTWACSALGIYIKTGDATVIGGTNRSEPYGIMVDSLTSITTIDLVRFNDNSVSPIGCDQANSTMVIGDGNDYGDWADGTAVVDLANMVQRSVASADPLNLPARGKFFQVTGTTGFGTLNGGWPGREVILSFAAALTVADGASMLLAGDFVTTAGDILHLVHNGAEWREISRSAN